MGAANSFYDSIGLSPDIVGLLIAITAFSGAFYFLIGIVRPIISSLLQMCYFEIQVYYSDPNYINFNLWLGDNTENMKFMRNYRTVGDQEGNDEKVRLVPGYGKSVIKAPGLPLILFERSKEEKKNIFEQPDILTFKFLFSSRESLRQFFDQVNNYNVTDFPRVYQSAGTVWMRVGMAKDSPKPLSSAADEMITDLQKFFDSEEEYLRRSIPYKRGYLLHGPPGTGKSSMIAYIAKIYGLDVYLLNAVEPRDLQSLISRAPSKAIIVIEDIDLTMLGGNHRNIPKSPQIGGPPALKSQPAEEDQYTEATGRDLLRTFLNSLDGINEYKGSIFICTTNDKDGLDPALVRPGRIDKPIEVGYLSAEEQIAHFERFFETEVNVNLDDIPLRTVAETQELCLINMNDEESALRQLVQKSSSLQIYQDNEKTPLQESLPGE